MLFDQTAPSTSFWTPPRTASGEMKTKLALFGYKADGTQNTWGKISSWIPGANVLYNTGAEKAAKDAGLSDVAGAIGDDLDNRLQKMQTLLSAGKAVVGAATANPALISSGVQGVIQGGTGLINAQDQSNPSVMQGTTSYQRFEKGGVATKPPKKNYWSQMVDNNRAAAGKPALATAPSAAPTSIKQAAAEAGADFTRNWAQQRAESGFMGLTPEDAKGIGTPTVQNSEQLNQSWLTPENRAAYPTASSVDGFYDPELDRSFVTASGSNERTKTAATHESAHDWQHEIGQNHGGFMAGKVGGAWIEAGKRALGIESSNPIQQSYNNISSEQARAAKTNTDPYLAKPNEVHARIMEGRATLGLQPGVKVDQSHINALKRKNPGIYQELTNTLDDKGLINVFNKTVMNDKPTDDGIFRAAGGGKLYDDNDPTEDLHLIDKKTGQKVGEMRYGERIFDQKATLKIEELAGKGDDRALGKFLRAELATHPDQQGKINPMFVAAGGGKPKPWVDSTTADPALVGKFNPLWPFAPAEVNPPKRDPRDVSFAPIPMTSIPDPGPSMLAKLRGMDAPTQAQIKATGASGATVAADEPKTDWLGMGADGVRAITAAIGAAQPLPTRPVNPEFNRMHRELADKQNEGLSAGERVNLLRQKAATQAAELQAIHDTAGGGGSGAAVLAAVNAAGARADNMGSSIEEADRQQRLQNKDNYYRDLSATQAGSDQLFAQQYNTALNAKNAYAQALGANLQNMADRQQYGQAYGKGSPYYQLMLDMMKKTGSQRAYADAPVTSLSKPS